MVKKKDIRKRVLEIRNNISKKEWEQKSYRIYEKVVTHPFFLESDVIYCYVAYRNEADTKNIIQKAWELNKRVAVPKVEGEEMNFYYISDFCDLKEGYHQIPEPMTIFPAQETKALVIMPGVAFDRNRNRIGYGKGFYDKYLAKHSFHKTIAIGFECQLVHEIEANAFDFQPDILITEEHIYDESFTK